MNAWNLLVLKYHAPSPSHSPSFSALQSSSLHQGIAAESTPMKDNPFAPVVNNPFINIFAPEPSSEASSFGDLIKPKNFKSAIIEYFWFQAMQDEIHEFDRLQVWELVPQPDCVMIIALKWIYKVKLDEYGDVLKNKASFRNSDACYYDPEKYEKKNKEAKETKRKIKFGDRDAKKPKNNQGRKSGGTQIKTPWHKSNECPNPKAIEAKPLKSIKEEKLEKA
ncbi:hypothetical protein Tco_1212202 [Tanacetum coccineum]